MATATIVMKLPIEDSDCPAHNHRNSTDSRNGVTSANNPDPATNADSRPANYHPANGLAFDGVVRLDQAGAEGAGGVVGEGDVVGQVAEQGEAGAE
jgi:hypothetical protein